MEPPIESHFNDLINCLEFRSIVLRFDQLFSFFIAKELSKKNILGKLIGNISHL